MSDSDISRTDLFALLVETRTAIDVLFEMMAFDRADGEEKEYRRVLSAMRARHKKALEQYRDASDKDLPDWGAIQSLGSQEPVGEGEHHVG